MTEPRLPDTDNPKPEISGIGSEHQTLRDSFRGLLNDVTDAAQYTETVYVRSDVLRRLGEIGTALLGDHEQMEITSKIDQKSGVVSYPTARFEIDRTVSDRRRQVATNRDLYDLPFAYYSFLDIDNFKHVNSVLTNPVADLIIRDVGKSLNQSMQSTRMGDFAMRHGGDEFGIWFGDLFGDPTKTRQTTDAHFHRLFEILAKLELDVNAGLRSEGMSLSEATLAELGKITFSLGFIAPSLRDVEDFKQGNSEIPDHLVIFSEANEQEMLAKIDKTTSTIAFRDNVYAIDGTKLN
jgi:GGDEF domain-containing protein